MIEPSQVKLKRKQLDVTQHTLAKSAGISQSLLAKIEAGSVNPSYSSVKKLDEALQLFVKKEEQIAVQIMVKKVVCAQKKTKRNELIALLQKNKISQVPIVENGQVVGLVTETSILEKKGSVAEELMTFPPAIVQETTPLSILISLSHAEQCILIAKGSKITGIITKADLLK